MWCPSHAIRLSALSRNRCGAWISAGATEQEEHRGTHTSVVNSNREGFVSDGVILMSNSAIETYKYNTLCRHSNDTTTKRQFL